MYDRELIELPSEYLLHPIYATLSLDGGVHVATLLDNVITISAAGDSRNEAIANLKLLIIYSSYMEKECHEKV